MGGAVARPKSARTLEIEAALRAGETVAGIAGRYDLPYQSVWQIAKWAGIDITPDPKRRQPGSMIPQTRAIKEGLERGMTRRQVSNALNVPIHTVNDAVLRWKMAAPPARDSGRTEAIMADLRTGMRPVDVARRHGVTRQHVHALRKRSG